MAENILVVNSGTSSIKLSHFSKKGRWDKKLPIDGSIETALKEAGLSVSAVGHRIVHGGHFTKSVLITDAVLKELEELSLLAPLHNPASLRGVYLAKELFSGQVPEVAVFDTSFHTTLPREASLYPLPYELAERHQIKRYGFHGISHEYLSSRYRETQKKEGKIITLHLGSGSSLAAIKNGVSIDTTMGFTPLDGIMMATRSGAVDPAIVSYLVEKEGKSAGEIVELLNSQSGLLGITGKTADMQSILAANDERSRLAIEMFLHSVLKAVGSFVALLGGVDALIFAGGIGENAPIIRSRLLHSLKWLGLVIDEAKNDDATSLPPGTVKKITCENSTISAFVIATDENLAIANKVKRLLANGFVEADGNAVGEV